MLVLKQLAPENSYHILGTFYHENTLNQPVLIAAVSDDIRHQELVAARVSRIPENYSFFLPEGMYRFYVFADLDRNGFFDQYELIGQTPDCVSFKVDSNLASSDVGSNGPKIDIDIKKVSRAPFPLHVKVNIVGNQFDTLDDAFFDKIWGEVGMYQPGRLTAHTQGLFFGMEPFDPNKTTVIFVHGINGTPRDWQYIVKGLDRHRFQPWFFYYPSGMPLNTLSTAFANSIRSASVDSVASFSRLVIVAHSMGGLVAKDAISRLSSHGTPPYLKMFISLSTPYGGNEFAQLSVERAPAVVPSWRDTATDSAYLKALSRKPFPKDVPFHLIFGYHLPSHITITGSSDGTITLRSQLDQRTQALASRIYGFDDTHSGILNDRNVRDLVTRLLDSASLQ